jgi:hypothetical protein
MSQTPCIAVVIENGMVKFTLLEDWPDGIPLPQVVVVDHDTDYADEKDLFHFSIDGEPVSALAYPVIPDVCEESGRSLSPKAVLEAIDARDGKAQVINYLTGYLGHDPACREQVQNFPEWSRLARQELERRGARFRRHAQFLEALPDEALHAIVQGEVDLAELAEKIPD